MAVGEGEVARMALGGVGLGDEDVPRGGDEEEDDGAGDGVELADASYDGGEAAAGEDEVSEDNEDGEDDADEALGENVEGAASGEEPAESWACVGLSVGLLGGAGFGEPVEVEGEGEPEADVGVGEEDAGEDEDAEAGEKYEAGVEAGSGGECAAGEAFEDEGEREDGECDGKARGGGADAEEFEAERHAPVEDGGLFEVADAIGVEGDPVVALEHLAGDFGVDGVGVVEERGDEEGEAGVEEEPEDEEDEAVFCCG